MNVTSTTSPHLTEREEGSNETNNQASSTYHYYGIPVVVPMSMAIVIFIILSIFGNIMVILTIVRHKGMRTRTNMFIVNLAVADVLTAAIDMPVSLVTINHGDWIMGDFFCKLNGFTMALLLICSIHTLMYISIHKYISITRPFSRAMNPRRILIMIAAAWCWSALCATGPLVGWNNIIYKLGSSQCGPSLPDGLLDYSHSIVITTTNYLIPLAVMIFCYCRIFQEIDEHMHRIRETSNIPLQNTLMQQKRMSVTLFLVLSCFLVCWTPFVLYSSTVAFVKDKSKVPLIVNPIAYWCGYMNSACNPIIYAFRSHSFRKGYKEIMCGRSSIQSSVGSIAQRSVIQKNRLQQQIFDNNGKALQDQVPASQIIRPPGERGRRKPFLSQTSWMSFTLLPFFSERKSANNSRFPNKKSEEFREVPGFKNKVLNNLEEEDEEVFSRPMEPIMEASHEESMGVAEGCTVLDMEDIETLMPEQSSHSFDGDLVSAGNEDFAILNLENNELSCQVEKTTDSVISTNSYGPSSSCHEKEQDSNGPVLNNLIRRLSADSLSSLNQDLETKDKQQGSDRECHKVKWPLIVRLSKRSLRKRSNKSKNNKVTVEDQVCDDSWNEQVDDRKESCV
ncbi:histamine H2 receptor-like [Limulus polyphemus]|uniref:Histamine H2 receptor-like n=1 Tax=Limulus polyphemus TaxID=6850 RepID=A0ABM1S3D8_LIMPO|nr:histamine H2 receptor-like [Limulus polyphemus]XP_013794804.1 histamine H2 receptor-like [Limulus polyphemus]XP_022238143.1 histamine H2 receptor-like [Limulus polyphemus]XP_022238144.1 histamine H2 receptor-like [Limulus polyphemus]